MKIPFSKRRRKILIWTAIIGAALMSYLAMPLELKGVPLHPGLVKLAGEFQRASEIRAMPIRPNSASDRDDVFIRDESRAVPLTSWARTRLFPRRGFGWIDEGPFAMCFEPHHAFALRFPDGTASELQVCFTCGNWHYEGPGEFNLPMNIPSSWKGRWKRLFRSLDMTEGLEPPHPPVRH